MIESVRRICSILNLFDEENYELGITEMANLLDLNVSTTHHLVSTLCQEGILVKTKNRKYRLGLKLFEWGNMVNELTEIRQAAKPWMQELSQKVNETVHLGVLQKNEVLYLEKYESKHSIRLVTSIGTKKPVHCTGLGKVLLAYQSPEVINAFNFNDLKPHTTNTITDSQKFKNELETIRKNGYAIDNEEYEIGLFCVSAPIFNYSNDVLCAISIAGPEFRVNKQLQKNIKEVIQTAKSISRELGYCKNMVTV